MAVNKVIYGGNTLVDLTGDTVTAADLADGVKATGADGNPIVGLMKKVTIDSSLSASSTNPVQNKVIKAALDGKVNKTDKIYEANLEWGGRNIANGYSPIDAAMISELGANRFAFGNVAGITIEYSTDAGSTWLDYGSSDTAKTALFTTASTHIIGKAARGEVTTDCMLRVTIDTDAFQVYTILNKFAIFMSTGTCTGCYCKIEASLESTPTEFVEFVGKASLGGNSGWNIVNISNLMTYGNAPTYQYGLIRFTFGCTNVGDASHPMTIAKIMGFGGVGWHTPSNMAKTGLLYTYNTAQEATFPAKVTAPNFIGNLTGTATEATKAQRLALQAGTTNVNRPVIFQDSANYASELLANRCSTFQYNPATDNLTVGKINGFTLGASVPANAKFTDTVYEHPPTHPASMITGLADVAKSGSYNDLADKPTIPASITIDSELSATSTNPVQNKVITEAIANIGGGSGNYLPLTGGTVTGGITASNFQTGTGTANYFQCRKFRGEGDANSYYHAIDFGYSGHDSVDFYEYDANWNFYQCTTGTKDGAVLVGNIDGNGWNGGARLTGAPTAPTATAGTNNTQIATTAFVHSAIPTNVSSFTNDAGYLTQHQSLDGYVKSVNGTKPDGTGNVNISVSGGGGVSLSTQNTWTAQQNFQSLKFDFEKYTTPRSSGAYDAPHKTTACYNATGAFTLNVSNLIAALNVGESTLFTAYITSSSSYSLSITNAGTLKYVGAASDLAITASGLLLNILIVKESSGTITSIVQATKLA